LASSTAATAATYQELAMSDTTGGTTGNESTSRGAIGEQTYNAVRELIAQGKKPTEAFAAVAEKTGRSAATVATAYYRTARKHPESGVKTRPRRATAAAASPRAAASRAPRRGREASTGDDLRALRRQTQDVLQALDSAIDKVNRLEADAQAYRDIQQVLKRA
jgi:hypothetical protein